MTSWGRTSRSRCATRWPTCWCTWYAWPTSSTLTCSRRCRKRWCSTGKSIRPSRCEATRASTTSTRNNPPERIFHLTCFYEIFFHSVSSAYRVGMLLELPLRFCHEV
ncbi:hypothetical protein MASSI9I_70156 [Massilia sp. 9I]|nr:hypothetical protein MASSI9I_70156 [Massilia sp. 9I]